MCFASSKDMALSSIENEEVLVFTLSYIFLVRVSCDFLQEKPSESRNEDYEYIKPK
jgi:hypothetical protein